MVPRGRAPGALDRRGASAGFERSEASWSAHLVGGLFIVTTLATLSPDKLFVNRVKDFRMGILAGVGLYLIGEHFSRRQIEEGQPR